MSATAKPRWASPAAAARRRAPASISSARSVATTSPSAPTRRATLSAGSPVPEARSRTVSPRATPAASTNGSFNLSAVSPTTSAQRSQLGPLACQSVRIRPFSGSFWPGVSSLPSVSFPTRTSWRRLNHLFTQYFYVYHG